MKFLVGSSIYIHIKNKNYLQAGCNGAGHASKLVVLEGLFFFFFVINPISVLLLLMFAGLIFFCCSSVFFPSMKVRIIKKIKNKNLQAC